MLDAVKIRNDWTREEAEAIYNQPLMDLLFQAQSVHREHFDPNQIQRSELISIKTGGCPEDCAYCSQSARNGSKLSASKLIEVERVIAELGRVFEQHDLREPFARVGAALEHLQECSTTGGE